MAMTATTGKTFDWVSEQEMPAPVAGDVVSRFTALDDLSATVSDALDALGVQGALGATTLFPTLPEQRIVGRAITLRNSPSRMGTFKAVSDGDWLMAEVRAVELAMPGDVVVASGLPGVSNMGGLVAALAVRGQLAGAVVDGAVRDVAQSRRRGFPIWTRDITPQTGKWRGLSVEINGTIAVGGVTVEAGDLVVADETGVCFVPHALIDDVIARCEAIDKKEADMFDEIVNGLPTAKVIDRLYGLR